jgi:hypothetical protein
VYLQVRSQSVIGCAQEVGISKNEMLVKKNKVLAPTGMPNVFFFHFLP